MSYTISSGPDGKPSVWPEAAVSRHANGVFKDIHGRVVKAPAVGMDAAHAVGTLHWFKHASEHEIASLVNRRCKHANDAANSNDADDHATLVATLLLPTALRLMADEDAAVGSDDKDSENHDLFNAGPEAEDEDGSEIGSSWQQSLEKAKAFWQRVAARNRQGSQLPGMTGRYASATALRTKSAMAADSASTPKKVDVVVANAKAATQYSMFKRF